jgi:putative oxidoreductase
MLGKLATPARYLLGLIFFVFGLNGFLNFIPQPPFPEGPTMTFMTGLMAAGYFFPFLKATEVICGLLLLLNKKVPLALLILAPIAVQILLFHTILVPEGAPIAIVIVVAGLLTANAHREAFSHVLK